jgi:hypothetical protein
MKIKDTQLSPMKFYFASTLDLLYKLDVFDRINDTSLNDLSNAIIKQSSMDERF